MVKHTQTIRRQQPTNWLRVFDHFVKLALKGLKLRVEKSRVDQLGSFIPISNLHHIYLLLLQYFVHTLIKWNFETIRYCDFFKQQIFQIRGKSKIHNLTTFSLAQLERLDDFTICKHALKKHVSIMERWSDGLVVKSLGSQSRDPVFKTTGWFQGRLSFSSFRGRSN